MEILEELSEKEFDSQIQKFFKSDQENGWELVKESQDKGVQIFQKKNGERKFLYKTVIDSGIKLEDTKELFTNIKLLSSESKVLKELNVIEKEENRDIFFMRVNIPIPFVNDRYDLVERRWKNFDEDGKKGFYMLSMSVKPKKEHKIEINGNVRMKSFKCKKVVVNPETKTTIITDYREQNIGGNIEKLGKMLLPKQFKDALMLKDRIQVLVEKMRKNKN